MGAISLILHAHLPAVAGTRAEVWFHEALVGSYLPLTRMLRDLEGPGRLTLSVSPPLIDMLSDGALLERSRQFLDDHTKLAEQHAKSGETAGAARAVAARALAVRETFDDTSGDLLGAWRDLRDAGRLELGTCAGTHAILPLLHTTDFQRMHLEHSVHTFGEAFGARPRFLWLPECGFVPGITETLADVGIWATVVEARALGEATPGAVRGKFAPVVSDNVAVFARDPQAGALVWSRDTGYPGDAAYREFHRDAAWDDDDDVTVFLRDGERIPSGVKLWSVTGPDVQLGDKAPWDPEAARARVAEHAEHFLSSVAAELDAAGPNLDIPAHLCCPFDAELFGHWWYEGPDFLQRVLEDAAAHGLDFVTPSDYLAAGPALQVATPAASTWGAGGDFSWWVDESTTWIIPLLHTAEERWLDVRRRDGLTPELQKAAEHLMAAQASDWPFAIRGVEFAEFAKEQIRRHVIAFDQLLKA